MVIIEFPDSSIKKFPSGTSALDVANSISEGLARNVLAAKVNNKVIDTLIPLEENNQLKLELLTWTDEQGKETMWHSSAHLMAEAIHFYYPKVKFAIGPPIEQGFYYDMEFPEETSFSSENFLKIEKNIRTSKRKKSIQKEICY